MPRPSSFERARAFITRSAPPSIQGSQGDNTTYSVACALVIEFALTDDEAWTLLVEYNQSKCRPPWDDRGLESKLRSARNMAKSKPGEVGKLLREDRTDYKGPSGTSPTGKGNHPQSRPGSTGPPSQPARPSSRTERTPLFGVSRTGKGAEPRTFTTLRTFVSNSLIQKKTTNTVYLSNKEPSEPSEKKEEPKVSEEPQEVPLAEFARRAAETSGNDVTVWLKKTGRTVRVYPSGKRKLIAVDEDQE